MKREHKVDIVKMNDIKEINPEYSLKGLMLKLQFWSLDVKSQLTGKDFDAGKD